MVVPKVEDSDESGCVAVDDEGVEGGEAEWLCGGDKSRVGVTSGEDDVGMRVLRVDVDDVCPELPSVTIAFLARDLVSLVPPALLFLGPGVNL